jgi:hypothetical protein
MWNRADRFRWRRGGTELIKRETAGFVDGDL